MEEWSLKYYFRHCDSLISQLNLRHRCLRVYLSHNLILSSQMEAVLYVTNILEQQAFFKPITFPSQSALVLCKLNSPLWLNTIRYY